MAGGAKGPDSGENPDGKEEEDTTLSPEAQELQKRLAEAAATVEKMKAEMSTVIETNTKLADANKTLKAQQEELVLRLDASNDINDSLNQSVADLKKQYQDEIRELSNRVRGTSAGMEADYHRFKEQASHLYDGEGADEDVYSSAYDRYKKREEEEKRKKEEEDIDCGDEDDEINFNKKTGKSSGKSTGTGKGTGYPFSSYGGKSGAGASPFGGFGNAKPSTSASAGAGGGGGDDDDDDEDPNEKKKKFFKRFRDNIKKERQKKRERADRGETVDESQENFSELLTYSLEGLVNTMDGLKAHFSKEGMQKSCPVFKGKAGESPEPHILQAEDWFTAKKIPPGEWSQYFKHTLQGDARLWYDEITVPALWTLMKDMFRTRYSTQGRSIKHLHERWRAFSFDKDNDDIEQFIHDVTQTAKQLGQSDTAILALLKSCMPTEMYGTLYTVKDLAECKKMLKEIFAKRPGQAAGGTSANPFGSMQSYNTWKQWEGLKY